MKKRIILFLALFLLVGCSADYTITINDDNSADEEVIIKNYQDYYDSYTIGSVVEETIITNDYYYDINDPDLTITRHTDNYINLIDNYEISNYFGNIKITTNKISFEPDYDKCLFLFSDGGEFVSDDTIKINVKVPFKVKSSNADSVNDNTYTWTYGINDCKKISYIEIKESSISIWSSLFILFLGIMICVFVYLRKKNNLR